jgi:hypothetical protein
MKANTRLAVILLLISAAVFRSCAPPAGEPETVTVYETVEVMVEGVEVEAEEEPPATTGQGANQAIPFQPRVDRLIIKDGEIKLLVSDTDTAIDRTTQVVEDVGGYIISSRVWYQEWNEENHKYSTMTIGVPVDYFEQALRRLRGLAIRVIDESASGEDVTDEYVDLDSRLESLEATRERILTFLDQAQNVEEALDVNEELAKIEEQIDQVQGRMNYLFDRAAYSTIILHLEPDVPTPEATPTPTSTPTPTPTPIPSWSPSKTVDSASSFLITILRALADIAIWVGIVLIPIVGPPLLIIWVVWRVFGRRKKKGDSKWWSKESGDDEEKGE